MAKGKNVLTTGDVAKICNVAPRTVSKWFDSGQLKGYRIPGSRDRRIPLSELMRFMKIHNIPEYLSPSAKLRVLIADSDRDAAETLAQALRTKADYQVQTVQGNCECGVMAQKFAPHVLLINLTAKGIDASDILKIIRSNPELHTIRVIALADKLCESEATALTQKGFDEYVANHTDLSELVGKIERTTAIVY